MSQNNFSVRDLVAVCVHYMGIKKRYQIVLKPKIKNASAYYWEMKRNGKLVYHLIHISLEGDTIRDTETLIVHELIHAWQAENGYTDTHGQSFKSMARRLESQFGIKNLYIPGTDI
jgi:SprT-like family